MTARRIYLPVVWMAVADYAIQFLRSSQQYKRSNYCKWLDRKSVYMLLRSTYKKIIGRTTSSKQQTSVNAIN
jgi:hypothetical protein